jgi:hypothetical protein
LNLGFAYQLSAINLPITFSRLRVRQLIAQAHSNEWDWV